MDTVVNDVSLGKFCDRIVQSFTDKDIHYHTRIGNIIFLNGSIIFPRRTTLAQYLGGTPSPMVLDIMESLPLSLDPLPSSMDLLPSSMDLLPSSLDRKSIATAMEIAIDSITGIGTSYHLTDTSLEKRLPTTYASDCDLVMKITELNTNREVDMQQFEDPAYCARAMIAGKDYEGWDTNTVRSLDLAERLRLDAMSLNIVAFVTSEGVCYRRAHDGRFYVWLRDDDPKSAVKVK